MGQSTKLPFVLAEGYEEAFMGIGLRPDGANITVYSMSVAVDLLTARSDMNRDEARRWLYACVRDNHTDEGNAPVWVEEMSLDEFGFISTPHEDVH
jgi:hypothetical protein